MCTPPPAIFKSDGSGETPFDGTLGIYGAKMGIYDEKCSPSVGNFAGGEHF